MDDLRPTDWAVGKLEDFLYRPLAYGVLKPEKFIGDGVPLIRIQDVGREGLKQTKLHRISTHLDQQYKRTKLNSGDLIISLVGTIGRVLTVPDELHGANVSRAFGVVGINNKLDTQFMYQYLNSQNVQNWINESAQGNAQKVLNLGSLRELLITYPPINEQKKIASILTSVDEVIENTQKQINKLLDLKKATMNELLTKGIGHTEFKESELGKIPKSWEVKNLVSVSLEKGIQTGPFGSQLHAHEYTNEGVPVVMPKDMKPPLITLSDIARIPEHRANDLSKHRVKKGDILFSRRGDIGRFALIEASAEGWVCGTGCLRVRLNNAVVHPYFIAQYLTKDEPKEWLNLNAVGLTMLNLSTSILEGLPLIVPPMEEQMIIVSALQSIDDRIFKCYEYLSRTESLKKSLMQDLMTGKIRV